MKHYYIILLLIFFTSCKKGWLDVKPSSTLVVPTTLADYQTLLDNTVIMNQNQCDLSEIGTGDFQLSYASYLKCAVQERNSYIWSSSDDFYEGQVDVDWRSAYQRILNANLVLEGVNTIERTSSNQDTWNNLKGSALFYRAYDFFALAQQYCKPYTTTAISDLGIPLRLNSNINLPSTRGTLKQAYEQVISDLNEAKGLLPNTPLFKTRPSLPAVYALLARIYLIMGDFPNALANANACLNLTSTLIDYSTLSTTATNPLARFNTEVIYQCRLGNATPFLTANLNVIPELLALYDSNDLRLKVFFRVSGTNTVFKGSYDGSSVFFSGLAVDELLLIRSECNARAGNITDALTDLNALLAKRWVKSPAYVNFTTTDKDVLLTKILTERRKELCFRGVRWNDLRRLNLETNHQVTLTKLLNGQTYQLPPNDLRYVLPIDPNEIRISGIPQNPRH